MGIYDRDYYREPQRRRGRSFGADWSMITKIIFINVVLFFADGLLTEGNALTHLLLLRSDTLTHSWEYWRFLTYGFVHDPGGINHILFNMLALFFLGYEVERRLGSKEFLRFYLATVLFGGVIWGILNIHTHSACLGASGGVVGVCILFALMFPRRILYIWGILPLPAYAVGALIVIMDVMGAINAGPFAGQRVAFAVHLAGAYFAFIYNSYQWHFGRMLDRLYGRFFKPRPKMPKPKLKVYNPEKEGPKTEDEKFAEQVDEVLKKYSRLGESALTDQEREILKKASEIYKNKKR
ncbi:MAG: rhomboid family intramembrane serine protease [Planctomycetaceae bacterium]|nr:rhomboid family intramembrane serine protease [Planctomycetaceae bacterium]